MKRNNWKQTAVFALSGLLAASLAGCMPTESSKPQGETTVSETQAASQGAAGPAKAEGLKVNTTDPITLRMNWWGGDSRHQATLEGIKAFEAKYPNIKVEAEYESFTGHEEKVALALKSGSAADVVQLNMDWVFNYSPDGSLFYDLNKVSDIIDLKAYDKSDLDYYTTNGVLQALPASNTGRVFFWNTTRLKDVGVEIPKNLDELYAVGEAFAAYKDGTYYPIILNELDRMTLMVYYLQCKYGKPWVENYQLQYSKEEIQKGLEWISLLEEKHVIPTLEVLAGDGSELVDTNQRWIDGHYAGMYIWDSNLKKYQEAAPGFEFEVGDYINMGDYKGGMTKASMVFAIPKSSKYPAESAALIQFLFGDPEGAKILGDTRGVPANKNGLASLDLSNSLAAIANKKVMEWTTFKFDPVFERSALKNPDGTYYMGMQMLSYKQDDAAGVAEYLVNDISKQLESAK
ncbi:ABC transporter substrate-binding protein [Lacrimispora defluvii]|uniref:Carbohydrate ABC transporter substrate-binding protein n=1 Tax=Lacrimispora defluvii TaxID=2719233 RepID=A0ABX1VSC9_9FIRM|nr:ABC transporter substrate-binding protein [Lacrimispora defluvii]NNJ30742.1 carbohydrate ABC transporter substrate-binding protein [Lacrimispora defluvii]